MALSDTVKTSRFSKSKSLLYLTCWTLGGTAAGAAFGATSGLVHLAGQPPKSVRALEAYPSVQEYKAYARYSVADVAGETALTLSDLLADTLVQDYAEGVQKQKEKNADLYVNFIITLTSMGIVAGAARGIAGVRKGSHLVPAKYWMREPFSLSPRYRINP